MATTVLLVPDPEIVLHRIEEIRGPLYSAFEVGLGKAEAYEYEAPEGAADDYVEPYLFAQIVRHHVKAQLRAAGRQVEDEFGVDEDVPNNGVCFTYVNYTIRLLKSDHRGGLPSAGKSDQRRDFYCQTSFASKMLGVSQDELVGLPLNLVVLYSRDGSLVLVCPKSEEPEIEDGRISKSAEAHWSIPIPHPAESQPVIRSGESAREENIGIEERTEVVADAENRSEE